MPPVSWIIRVPAKRTVIRKQEVAILFRTSTNAARMTPIISINVSAGQTFIPVHRRYRVSAPPAVVNMPTVNARVRIVPAPAEKLPELLPAPGAGQPNIHHAKAATPLQVLRHLQVVPQVGAVHPNIVAEDVAHAPKEEARDLVTISISLALPA